VTFILFLPADAWRGRVYTHIKITIRQHYSRFRQSMFYDLAWKIAEQRSKPLLAPLGGGERRKEGGHGGGRREKGWRKEEDSYGRRRAIYPRRAKR